MTKDKSIDLNELNKLRETSAKLPPNDDSDAATRMWRESLAFRAGIAKEKDEWRKKHPSERPHEYRTPWFDVDLHEAIVLLAATLTAVPTILVPSLNEDINQIILWGVITSIVVQEETGTGCMLKGRLGRTALLLLRQCFPFFPLHYSIL